MYPSPAHLGSGAGEEHLRDRTRRQRASRGDAASKGASVNNGEERKAIPHDKEDVHYPAILPRSVLSKDGGTTPHRRENLSERRHNHESTNSRVLNPPVPSKRKRNPPREFYCKLCKDDKSLNQRSRETDMVQCELLECGTWWHISCLAAGQNIMPQKFIWIAQPTAQCIRDKDGPYFVCPTCYPISGAIYTDGELSKILPSLRVKTPIPTSPAVDTTRHPLQQGLVTTQTVQSSDTEGTMVTDQAIKWPFQASNNTDFRGYNGAVMDPLMRELTRSIEGYNREISDIIERFSRTPEYHTELLSEWSRVDGHCLDTEGITWYIADHQRHSEAGHAPLTSALREMLGTPNGQTLVINPIYRNIDFSQLHTTFVWSFVMDVLGRKLDLCELPNMNWLETTRWAALDLAKSQWEANADDVLREFMLRVWSRQEFKEDLKRNKNWLTLRFEQFLEPLTSGLPTISLYSHHKDLLIETLVDLWSYFWSLQGDFVVIKPEIGAKFDPSRYEKKIPDSPERLSSDCFVTWVVRNGLEYHRPGKRHVTTMKAIVLVDT
ncbi:hypothetical protein VTL71DRAFT_14100 [Oculimacula yallundae]|uniref:Zinc finger PHD-type domain-containing protein n=1 Tax=Oculimacula yallundae TaxID=86028 RepID=A0ABR4CJL0_9HELO